MDLFNAKKIAALEARIAALEPKPSVTDDDCEDLLTLDAIEKRVKKLEEEVLQDTSPWYAVSLMRMLYNDDRQPRRLTLRDKVERLCDHLKIKFVTEPQRTVIKPVKEKR